MPSFDAAARSMGDGVSSFGDATPSMGDGMSSFFDAAPSMGDGVSTIGDATPSMGDGMSSFVDAAPSIGDGIPSFDAAVPNMGDGLPPPAASSTPAPEVPILGEKTANAEKAAAKKAQAEVADTNAKEEHAAAGAKAKEEYATLDVFFSGSPSSTRLPSEGAAATEAHDVFVSRTPGAPPVGGSPSPAIAASDATVAASILKGDFFASAAPQPNTAQLPFESEANEAQAEVAPIAAPKDWWEPPSPNQSPMPNLAPAPVPARVAAPELADDASGVEDTEMELADGWQVVNGTSGTYFWNPASGKTTWEMPTQPVDHSRPRRSRSLDPKMDLLIGELAMRQIDGFKETAPRPPPPPPPRSMSFGASNIASPVGASTTQLKGLTDTVLKAKEETLSPKSHVVAAAGAVVEVEVYAGCAGGAGSTSAAAPPSPPDSLQVCRLCPDQGPVSRSHLQRCPSCRSYFHVRCFLAHQCKSGGRSAGPGAGFAMAFAPSTPGFAPSAPLPAHLVPPRPAPSAPSSWQTFEAQTPSAQSSWQTFEAQAPSAPSGWQTFEAQTPSAPSGWQTFEAQAPSAPSGWQTFGP
jgi:hypothetical protein